MGFIKPMKKISKLERIKFKEKYLILSFRPALARLMNNLKAYSCNCKTISF